VAVGFLFSGRKSGTLLPVFLPHEETVGREFAAAVVGDNGEFAGGGQFGEDVPNAPVAEASAAL
jgi:hypothetical protein